MGFDLEKLKAEMMACGQLSDFLEVVEATTPLYNCSTIEAFPEGPNGPDNQGNLYLRHNVLCAKGAQMQGECHPFPHTSIIFGAPFLLQTWNVNAEGKRTGPIKEKAYGERRPGIQDVVYTDESGELRTFASVYIAANLWHKFTTLSPGGTLICIYAMRNSRTGEFADQFDGDRQPYSQKKTPWVA